MRNVGNRHELSVAIGWFLFAG